MFPIFRDPVHLMSVAVRQIDLDDREIPVSEVLGHEDYSQFYSDCRFHPPQKMVSRSIIPDIDREN